MTDAHRRRARDRGKVTGVLSETAHREPADDPRSRSTSRTGAGLGAGVMAGLDNRGCGLGQPAVAHRAYASVRTVLAQHRGPANSDTVAQSRSSDSRVRRSPRRRGLATNSCCPLGDEPGASADRPDDKDAGNASLVAETGDRGKVAKRDRSWAP